jgi:hypothetical protein
MRQHTENRLDILGRRFLRGGNILSPVLARRRHAGHLNEGPLSIRLREFKLRHYPESQTDGAPREKRYVKNIATLLRTFPIASSRYESNRPALSRTPLISPSLQLFDFGFQKCNPLAAFANFYHRLPDKRPE